MYSLQFMIKVVTILLSLLVLFSNAYGNNENGQVDIREFSLNPIGMNVYSTRTKVEIRLSSKLRNTLFNGIKLAIKFQFSIGKHNIWWWDSKEMISELHYELRYHSISKQYIVTNINSNQFWNFNHLSVALSHISKLDGYILPQMTNVVMDGRHYLFLQTIVYPESPNLPLKMQQYFNSQYRLESEGVLWELP